MNNSLNTPFKLQTLQKLIEQKAKERNKEIGRDFFSLDGTHYSYVDSTIYDTYELMTFSCPKSRSTISIKIIKDIKNNPEG